MKRKTILKKAAASDEAIGNIEAFLSKYLITGWPIERVDAYVIADGKKWYPNKAIECIGIEQTLHALSGFPHCYVFLDYGDVPDAEKQIADMGFPSIKVIRYNGGSKRKAVIRAEAYAKRHSLAYVICDCDMLSTFMLKAIDPISGEFICGDYVMLPAGSITKQGKVRGAKRKSYQQFGEGSTKADATPEAGYMMTLLAANVARTGGFSGWTFPHQHRPHEYRPEQALVTGSCQGNFRGWFSDAAGSYALVDDLTWDTDNEDFSRSIMACKPGKAAVLSVRLAAIKFHVDKKRQATLKHKKSVYKLRAAFEAKGIKSRPYTTRDTGAYCLSVRPTPVRPAPAYFAAT